MQPLNRIDLRVRRTVTTPAFLFALTMLIGALLWVGETLSANARADDSLAQLLERVERRRGIHDAAKRALQRRTPEQQRARAALRGWLETPARLQVVDQIEASWTPQIALRMLSIQQIGKQATLDAQALNLVHAYGFVERLRRAGAARVTLVRHGVVPKDPSRSVVFSVRIEQ